MTRFLLRSGERNILKFGLGLIAICLYYIYEMITVGYAYSFFFAVALFLGIFLLLHYITLNLL